MAIGNFVSDFINLATTGNEALVSFTGTTGIAGFIFDIKEDEEITLENDITDHYTESNNPVQDNIVNKPVKVTLRGTVGEWVYNPPKKLSNWEQIIGKVRKTTDKLTIIGSYLPALNTFSQQVFNSLENEKPLQAVWNIGSSAFDLFNDVNVPNDRQSRAFLFFEALWQSKQVFSIQTPYRHYSNMAIETIKAVQSGETDDNTDFEITFKQIRKVISNIPRNRRVLSLWGRLSRQSSSFVNNYITRGKIVTIDTRPAFIRQKWSAL